MTTTVPQTTEGPARTPRRFSARALLSNQLFGATLVAVLIVIGWQVMSGLTFVIPSPLQTLTVLVQNLSDPAYLFDLQVTAQSVGLACRPGGSGGAST